jgi:HPt (histidine-containing phosphotransfer) domain-containing protein
MTEAHRPEHDRQANPGGGPGAPPEVLDRAELLDRVGGDIELLRKLVALFLADCPRLLGEIQEAVTQADLPRLKRAAHTFKGAVGNFAASAACAAALQLETVAHGGDMARAADAYAALAGAVARLLPELRALAGGGDSS